jgi:hypothetical protein
MAYRYKASVFGLFSGRILVAVFGAANPAENGIWCIATEPVHSCTLQQGWEELSRVTRYTTCAVPRTP